MVDKIAASGYNILCRHASVGKRRSISGCSAVLVARLNGVQEAVSSILATRTKRFSVELSLEGFDRGAFLFFVVFGQKRRESAWRDEFLWEV